MANLQDQLDQITQNTRKLVQPERLAISEAATEQLFLSGIEDRVLPVGALAPEFHLPDARTGKLVDSTDLLALGPLVLNFFRGRWCPYCITELEIWRDLHPEVRRRNAFLVAISPQTLRQNEFALQQHDLPFPLLTDTDAELAGKFGIAYTIPEASRRYYQSILVNIPYANSGSTYANAPDSAWRLPLPATFVIGQDSRILFSEAHADFRVRPEPLDILAALPQPTR